MKNQAFTLIELLVVVLIIGILAAIAVPQYQKAVAKAELAQLLSAVKSLKQAEKVYYLANGVYTDNINDLDLSWNNEDIKAVFACWNEKKSCAALLNNKNFAIWARVYENSIECAAKTDNINSALAYACTNLTKNTAQLSGSADAACISLGKVPCIISDGAITF